MDGFWSGSQPHVLRQCQISPDYLICHLPTVGPDRTVENFRKEVVSLAARGVGPGGIARCHRLPLP